MNIQHFVLGVIVVKGFDGNSVISTENVSVSERWINGFPAIARANYFSGLVGILTKM